MGAAAAGVLGGGAADEGQGVGSSGSEEGSRASDGEGDGLLLLEAVGAWKEVGWYSVDGARLTYKEVRKRELGVHDMAAKSCAGNTRQ